MTKIRSASASYLYVRENYGVFPAVGHRVRHTEINKFGTIARENKSQSHYVMVKLDGQRFASPCHPTALDYSPVEPQQ